MLVDRAIGCDGAETGQSAFRDGSGQPAGGLLLNVCGGEDDDTRANGRNDSGVEAKALLVLLLLLLRSGTSGTGSGRSLRESNDTELDLFSTGDFVTL